MTDKEYKIYDKAVGFLIQEITQLSKDADEINLINFEPNSHEHMTVFYAAMYGASLTGKVVDTSLSLSKYLKLKYEHKGMKKWFRNTPKANNTITNIDVPHLIGKVYMEVEGAEIFTTGIGCIYDAYYDPNGKEEND